MFRWLIKILLLPVIIVLSLVKWMVVYLSGFIGGFGILLSLLFGFGAVVGFIRAEYTIAVVSLGIGFVLFLIPVAGLKMGEIIDAGINWMKEI